MDTAPLVPLEKSSRRLPSKSPKKVRTQIKKTETIQPSTAVNDYKLACISRQISVVGRREVLNGRAKFGIFGAGKEIIQIGMAQAFKKGDFRAGYYRDQTLMLALDLLTSQQLFAALYAHADVEAEPTTAGRIMNSHFGTRFLDEDGNWLPQSDRFNSASDTSPTAGQMPRMVGLGYASRLYRELAELQEMTDFSNQGSEVVFGTIGNASSAEGPFWEAVNAIGVLQAPVVLSIYDDGYGISVPNSLQFTKGSIGPLLNGFQRQEGESQGFNIYTVAGWDYQQLVDTYAQAAADARQHHIPALVHVIDVTQPQGHSSSGSHERYKSPERLAWETENDGLTKMRQWLLDSQLATESQLGAIEKEAAQMVHRARKAAWQAFVTPQKEEAHTLCTLLADAAQQSANPEGLNELIRPLAKNKQPHRKELFQTAHKALKLLHKEQHPHYLQLLQWREDQTNKTSTLYNSHLNSQSEQAALNIEPVTATYGENPTQVRGFELLRDNFDKLLENDPRIIVFGEDVGYLGGVNQGFAGLQKKYGPLRVSDTGIREMTIIGQAIGLAQRGLRPIAEIQYIDYILYALPALSDDLATLHWRTKGGQKAPVIVRTRGHRLEGVWHSGSPMGALLTLLRGMHILVPRNMTQAAGFYNTLLQADEPALVVERLNGYRLSEPMPTNLGEYKVPLGVPELLLAGEDVTLVTYGANCDYALNAARALAQENISVEVIDVQSLLPFDVNHLIVNSVAKTNRLVVLDEDVPGGASAFMMYKILEEQGGYEWLDSDPRTITGKEHRPAYGTDGDYFSKPNVEEIVETIYDMMHESNPAQYPRIWSAEELKLTW